MTEHIGKTFQSADIQLDGGVFKDCAFFDCTLRFDDEEDCTIENCGMVGGEIIFGSQEAHDAFMKALAADGGGNVWEPKQD